MIDELQLIASPRGHSESAEVAPDPPSFEADGLSRFSLVPQQLRERRQWVTYRLVMPYPFPDDGYIQLLPFKPKKHPFDAKTGAPASELDPATWSTFQEASAALMTDGYDGIGYVFSESDPFIGIDLDYACDPTLAEALEPGGETHLQAVKSWAAAIVRRHAPKGYVEISQSKRGLHVICRGRLPGAGGKRLVFDPAGEIVGQIEMYDRNKFFAVTGQELMGIHQPRVLRGDQMTISATYQTFGFHGLAPSNEAIRW